MNEHITDKELRQYFEIILSGMPEEGDADFADEIEAHAAGCGFCSERMQTVRFLMEGFSSNPHLAEALIHAEFPETLVRPAFDVRKAFPGIKVIKADLAGKIRMLADTLSDRLNVTFTPCPATVRGGNGEEDGGVALNDLLCSDMEIPLEEGRRIALRCRNAGPSDRIRLYVSSNFEADFLLASGGGVPCPAKTAYDEITREIIRIYELDGEEFTLTIR